jgi:hypothetical protein
LCGSAGFWLLRDEHAPQKPAPEPFDHREPDPDAEPC